MFTLYVMVPFSMSIPLKKYCWAKLWKRITTINDMVSILSSWEKMNCLNLVKHNRIQIVQAWLTAEWSKILSYWEKSSQFFYDSSWFKILNIWRSCRTFLPMNYPIHIELSTGKNVSTMLAILHPKIHCACSSQYCFPHNPTLRNSGKATCLKLPNRLSWLLFWRNFNLKYVLFKFNFETWFILL